MEPKLHRRVQRLGWDRAAGCYERYWQRQLRPATDCVLERAALRPGDDVVDVATGTGVIALAAAERVGPTGRVLAIDISPTMIGHVAGAARARGLTNVDATCRDAEHLAEDGGFDVAVCALGLMYVPSPDAALDAMRRALRPGGRVVVSVWGQRQRCGWAGIFPIVDARVRSDVCPMFFALGSPGALVATMERCGFTDVDETRLRVELCYADAADALGAAFLGGPVALAHSRFDESTRATAHAEYLASIRPHRDGGGYRVPGEFVIVAATRPATTAAPSTEPLPIEPPSIQPASIKHRQHDDRGAFP